MNSAEDTRITLIDVMRKLRRSRREQLLVARIEGYDVKEIVPRAHGSVSWCVERLRSEIAHLEWLGGQGLDHLRVSTREQDVAFAWARRERERADAEDRIAQLTRQTRKDLAGLTPRWRPLNLSINRIYNPLAAEWTA